MTSYILAFAVNALLLVSSSPSQVQASSLRTRERQLGGGGVYASCNSRSPCAQGLDCIRTFSRKGRLCYPQNCLQQAAAKTGEENGLDAFADHVLEQAGLKIQDIFQVGHDDGALNEGVQDKLEAAMLANTSAVSAWGANARSCFEGGREGNGTSPLQTESFYVLINIEFALGVKYHVQAGTIASENGADFGCFSHMCIGAGPKAIAHISTGLGVLSSGNPDDIKSGNFMFDADLTVFLHLIGGAVGWTFDGFLRTEYSSIFIDDFSGEYPGGGIGAGAGGYVCANI